MTQEEKELLLKELCARLPYGVMCFAKDEEYGDLGVLYDIAPFETEDPNVYIQYDGANTINFFLSEIKPYLRPMSSMSESEISDYNWFCSSHPLDEHIAIDFVDWLHAHYLDYSGLIEKGMALEAPKWMYEI